MRRLRRLLSQLRLWPQARQLLRRNWVDTPDELFRLAAQHWRARDDLALAELTMLHARSQVMSDKTGDQDWVVAAAALLDLSTRWVDRQARHISSSKERAEYRRVRRMLAEDRQKLPTSPEFEAQVRAAVNRVLTWS